MSDPIVIEPGTPAYEQLRQAIEFNRKISLDDRGPGRVAVKQSEFMWTPTLRSVAEPSIVYREPPANT